MATPPTPSQTIGPFFHVAVAPEPPVRVAPPDDPAAVLLDGQVFDGAGEPVVDALVEVLEPAGGLGRCATDGTGRYAFVVPVVPYLSVRVFARGLLRGLDTRCYLPERASATADDVVAALSPEQATTLFAVAAGPGFRFDIHLQGDAETTFFAL
jgi:protocatechuate 3,4-dioxygenase, alpha subunit